MTDNTYLLNNALTEAQNRIYAQEQGRQHDQKYWADQIYGLKQRIEKLEQQINMPQSTNTWEKEIEHKIDKLEQQNHSWKVAVTNEIMVLKDHHTRQIDENRKISRRVDEQSLQLECLVEDIINLKQQNPAPKAAQKPIPNNIQDWPAQYNCADQNLKHDGQLHHPSLEVSEKPKFAVGDKVRIYDRTEIHEGIIFKIDLKDKTLYLENTIGWFYFKQCRKLRKKK